MTTAILLIIIGCAIEAVLLVYLFYREMQQLDDSPTLMRWMWLLFVVGFILALWGAFIILG